MTRLLAAALAALTIAGCAGMSGPAPASRESLLTASATVESVDQDTRLVRLRDDATGESFTVQAGPEVRNLAQLAAGDTVTLDYYESMTVAMAQEGDPAEETAVLAGRAPEGALPGGIAVVSTEMVVQVREYDPSSGVATFVAPDGTIRRTTVAPELRPFAAQRRRGDLVRVTITEAVAVTITESAA